MDGSTRPSDKLYGVSLVCLDVKHGKIRWQRKTADPLVGGVLVTVGGVAFTGEGNGNFSAFGAGATRHGATSWMRA